MKSKTEKGGNKKNHNIQQISLSQKHDPAPNIANIEPKDLQPKDSFLQPWNKHPSQCFQPKRRQGKEQLIVPQIQL